MVKRIAAILFIFACTSVAWMILGTSIFLRTQNAGAALSGVVASNWGAPQTQPVPYAYYETREKRSEEIEEKGRKFNRVSFETVTVPLPLNATRMDILLDLEHRQKGLLWYSTYKVGFAGDFSFSNPTSQDQVVHFTLPFPASQAIYDDLVFTVDGRPVPITNEKTFARAAANVPAGRDVTLRVGYRSQGLGRWGYSFGGDVSQVRDFTLNVRTNFKAVDFPENTLSPTTKRETPEG